MVRLAKRIQVQCPGIYGCRDIHGRRLNGGLESREKGSSTLYYTVSVYKKRSGGGLTDTNLVQRGSFKTSTPLKSFNVKTIRNKTGKGTYVIQLDCYSDSGKRNYIGTFESAKFQIK